MMYVTGRQKDVCMDLQTLLTCEDQADVKTTGMVYTVKNMGDFAFLCVRKNNGIVQCVLEKNNVEIRFHLNSNCNTNSNSNPNNENLNQNNRNENNQNNNNENNAVNCNQNQNNNNNNDYHISWNHIPLESAVEVEGRLVKDSRSPNGFEIHAKCITILSMPHEQVKINLAKKKLAMSLETKVSLRPITLRNIRERAVFKLQEGIIRGFRGYFFSQGFTEVHTPKIVASGAEGGANIFRLDYFGKKAYLAQSPQFYKQTLVGVYERVFEIGPVFRAEKHNTTRHLNEYVSVDMEMGFIRDFTEIMDMEAGALQYIMAFLKKEYAKELDMLQISLPDVSRIPAVRFQQAKELVSQAYGRKIKDPYDLEPEEEQLISKYFAENYESDFVFVTHYPSKKRPFYAMDDPENPKYTLSFDLLFRGMEVTTGGQRIHDYQTQVDKMIEKGLDPADFESYLMIHQCGMPPHGGLGLGLERLMMKLIGESNVRATSMFPRDMNHLTP